MAWAEDLGGIEPEGPMALLRAPAEIRRQILERAAAEAAEDYAVDPEVADFLDFHDFHDIDDDATPPPPRCITP